MMAIKKMLCPLMGKECIEDAAVVNGELHACRFWIKIVGKHPQTGAEVDNFDCAFAWMPVLMIENSQQQRSTGAAVESFRNEMVKANETSQQVLLAAARTSIGIGS
jgi:hypothetical protein